MEEEQEMNETPHEDSAEEGNGVNVEDAAEDSADEEEDECRVCRGPAEEG